jgi:hypothetical protein
LEVVKLEKGKESLFQVNTVGKDSKKKPLNKLLSSFAKNVSHTREVFLKVGEALNFSRRGPSVMWSTLCKFSLM